MFTLWGFVTESNRIEGIARDPTFEEMIAHERLLAIPRISVEDMQKFVETIEPGAKLRDRAGMNVWVGNHYPPAGGEPVRDELADILDDAALGIFGSVYEVHHRYETLHPFMDGNGRSGRALWLWQMGGPEKTPLGFLHHWYYQSLSYGGKR